MRKLLCLFFLLIVLIVRPGFSQDQKPDSAQNIIANGIKEVVSSDRKILVFFHASWCISCKWLEAALESPEVKPIIEKNYTIVKLDVKEFGGKIQTLENPGSQELLEEFGGGKSGLPFYAILNKKGKLIANSNMESKNKSIGYPGTKEEIDAFIGLLKKTSSRLTNKQAIIISNALKKNAQQ
jgi:thioredoxin-related protein